MISHFNTCINNYNNRLRQKVAPLHKWSYQKEVELALYAAEKKGQIIICIVKLEPVRSKCAKFGKRNIYFVQSCDNMNTTDLCKPQSHQNRVQSYISYRQIIPFDDVKPQIIVLK